jgi:omega-3 fatty acid desaturase (delta-15 desaturase)
MCNNKCASLQPQIERKTQVPSLIDLKKAIPAHCFKPSLATSLYYVVKDISIISLLFFIAVKFYSSSWYFLISPLYWFCQGTMFWAIFVLGHDCGHGSFSAYPTINSIVGHLLHSAILVPFHSWRISHKKHHKNTGNYEKDEIFYPMAEDEYRKVPRLSRWIYSNTFFMFCFGFPIYLIRGYGGRMKYASHFSSSSELFRKEDQKLVRTSVLCILSMIGLLSCAIFRFGLWNILYFYGIPYLVFCSWLLVVTFLHHTGPGAEWYDGSSWSYVLGNLQCVNRVYGWIEPIHHNIGCHTVHHLFPSIPHYRLREADAALAPILGNYRKEDNSNTFSSLWTSFRIWSRNHVIPDNTKVFVLPAE